VVVAVEDAGLPDSRYAISELLVGRTVSKSQPSKNTFMLIHFLSEKIFSPFCLGTIEILQLSCYNTCLTISSLQSYATTYVLCISLCISLLARF